MDPTGAPQTGLDAVTVLLVDDEPSVLTGLRRILHGRCIVHIETDPRAALELLDELPDLAVVISDMRMPEMDGAQFLSEVRRRVPDVTRVLLTGHADLDLAVSAINDGRIFRFLWKPVSPDTLFGVIGDAAEQHRLVVAERELLEQTLHGSVRALLETLSLANPLAFSRAERIRNHVAALVSVLDVEQAWEVDLAAMLSQLGAVTLPPSVTERLHAGDTVSGQQQLLVDAVPATSVQLLADVPRLGGVREAIRLSPQRYDGRGPVQQGLGRDDIPLGARILAVAVAYDACAARGVSDRVALEQLRADTGRLDPRVLDALEQAATRGEDGQPVERLRADELEVGHVLAADLLTIDGVLLCGRGQAVTERLLSRIENWSRSPGLVEPVEVLAAEACAQSGGA